jgi:hypothetical protein
MGQKTGVEFVGETSPESFDQDDMASEMKGKNRLQGNDQARVHSERTSLPDQKREPEGLIESFERMDPKTRAGG